MVQTCYRLPFADTYFAFDSAKVHACDAVHS